MLIEKYVQRPRHIEIQVFGDTHGNCVYLFERDCSVQRRHQKVLEEAPAPGMTEAMRQQMGERRGGGGAGGRTTSAPARWSSSSSSADGEMHFFFMEMNTRLQVEHPVTEAITGLDLVEWQLRVAAGEPLPLQQDQLQHPRPRDRGAHLRREPRQQLPAGDRHACTCTASRPTSPSGACRGERRTAPRRCASTTACARATRSRPIYDSMIAKLIVHGDTREQALARLDEALAQTHIVGLSTNVQFLRHVVRSPSFAQADLDTALIPRERRCCSTRSRWACRWPPPRAVAQALVQEQALREGADPFSRRDGWRSHGVTRAPLRVRVPRRAGAGAN